MLSSASACSLNRVASALFTAEDQMRILKLRLYDACPDLKIFLGTKATTLCVALTVADSREAARV